MNNDLINELYSKIDNQEKIIVDLQKNNSGITLEEHVRVLNAYQELQEKYNKQKEVIDKTVLELVSIDGNLSNSQLSDRICNLIDILNEVSE